MDAYECVCLVMRKLISVYLYVRSKKENFLRTVVTLIILFDVCCYFDNLKFTLILLV